MKGFFQRILQEIMKKMMLGTSDGWLMRQSYHLPSYPSYHIEDCRIYAISMAAPWVTRFYQGFVWLFPIEVTEIYYAGKLHQLYNKSLSSLSHHLLSFLHGAHTGHSTYTVALVSLQLVEFISETAFFFYVNCPYIDVLVKYSKFL